MSVFVMSWVWKNGPTEPTDRLVLLAIADHADDHGRAYPSMSGIAEKACVTERGARGIVRRLEASGWISTKVGGGRGGKSHYTVIMDENPERETRNAKPGNRNPERETRKLTTVNPEADDTKPGTRVPPNHQGTIKEPSKTRVKPVDVLCEVLSPQVAQDFIDHRKAIRKPLTAKAAQLIVGRLTGCPDPDAVANTSIMNGWQGVFPENGQIARGGSPSRPSPDRRRAIEEQRRKREDFLASRDPLDGLPEWMTNGKGQKA